MSTETERSFPWLEEKEQQFNREVTRLGQHLSFSFVALIKHGGAITIDGEQIETPSKILALKLTNLPNLENSVFGQFLKALGITQDLPDYDGYRVELIKKEEPAFFELNVLNPKHTRRKVVFYPLYSRFI